MVSIVVPCFNERGNIKPLLDELDTALQTLGEPCEVVLVDDASTDGTAEEIRSRQKQFSWLKLVHLSNRQGKTAALQAGFRHSSGEAVVVMDGDLQYSPAEIPCLLKEFRGGYDVVSAWRKDRKDSPSRFFQSRCFHAVVRLLFGVKFQDMNSGLKVYRRAVLNALSWRGQAHRYALLIAMKKGFRVTEVPVSLRRRRWGSSKYGWCRLPSVLLDLARIYFRKADSRRF